MADELSETIKTAAQNPKRVNADGFEVEAQPVSEIIKADQYTKAQSSMSSPKMGLTFGRMVPPGAV